MYRVQKTKSDRRSWNISSDLCHDAYKGNHSHCRALAAHVWPGDDFVPCINAAECAGVRYERVGTKSLYHGMSAINDFQDIVLLEYRSMIILLKCDLGQTKQTIRSGQLVDCIPEKPVMFVRDLAEKR